MLEDRVELLDASRRERDRLVPERRPTRDAVLVVLPRNGLSRRAREREPLRASVGGGVPASVDRRVQAGRGERLRLLRRRLCRSEVVRHERRNKPGMSRAGGEDEHRGEPAERENRERADEAAPVHATSLVVVEVPTRDAAGCGARSALVGCSGVECTSWLPGRVASSKWAVAVPVAAWRFPAVVGERRNAQNPPAKAEGLQICRTF